MGNHGRGLLFYSQWPLGFYNPEGERKAVALSQAGWDVVYVPGIGIRNPNPARPRKLASAVGRVLRSNQVANPPAIGGRDETQMRSAALGVLPPRQVASVKAINVRWVAGRLRKAIRDWDSAVAWIRYPTPELVAALELIRPGAVVYECVDAYEHTPGIIGSWRDRFLESERRLIALSDRVIAPSDELAERLQRAGGAVQVVSHGVDAAAIQSRQPELRGGDPVTLGYVGTLDDRIDTTTLCLLAERHKDWRIRLIGPIRDSFDSRALALPNITIEPPVATTELGDAIASFDVGLMPYLDQPVLRYMCPVKNLEFMAAGKPAVARPNRALRNFSELLYFAEDPETFCAQVERALADDSPELAWRRRRVASEHDWERKLDQIVDVADQL